MNTIPQDTPQRQCTGPCQRFLPLTRDYFHRKNSGFMLQCKQCRSEQRKAEYRNPEIRARIREQQKRYYDNNPQTIKAGTKRYREQNGGETYRQKRKQYRDSRPEKEKEYRKIKYQRHKQSIQERDKKWRKTEAGRAYSRAYVIRRRAMHRKVEGHFTAIDIKQQYARQKGKCYYCQQKVGKDYEIDHAIPLSRGGTNDLSNIVIACRPCNRKKSDKLPHEFFEGGRLF